MFTRDRRYLFGLLLPCSSSLVSCLSPMSLQSYRPPLPSPLFGILIRPRCLPLIVSLFYAHLIFPSFCSMAQSPFRSHMFSAPPMQPVTSSELFQRRQQEFVCHSFLFFLLLIEIEFMTCRMLTRPDRLFELTCERCGDRFDVDEVHVLVDKRRWHTDCFRFDIDDSLL